MADEPGQVVCEVFVEAPPETVFAYLVDPARMQRWMGRVVRLEPRPGGLYRVDIDGQNVARGTFQEVVPPRRVVFSFGWEGEGATVPAGSTTVTISLEPEGEGTRVRLVHEGLPPAAMEAHREGWEHYLPRLALVAAGADPGPDPWAGDSE